MSIRFVDIFEKYFHGFPFLVQVYYQPVERGTGTDRFQCQAVSMTLVRFLVLDGQRYWTTLHSSTRIRFFQLKCATYLLNHHNLSQCSGLRWIEHDTCQPSTSTSANENKHCLAIEAGEKLARNCPCLSAFFPEIPSRSL